MVAEAKSFQADILRAVERSVASTEGGKFLPPIVGLRIPFGTMTQDTLAFYTNYRYWPEALSAGCGSTRPESVFRQAACQPTPSR